MISPVELNQLEDRHSSGAYLKRDLQIVRGAGARLWDADGNEYVDLVGGQGSGNLGHAHPAILQALREQSEQLMICNELFHNPVRARYQAELCRASKMDRVFLCNSGAEANEGAIKFARILTGRTKIIATMRGFHGRTNGALSATWNKAYRKPFEPLLPDVTHVPYNKIEKLEAAIDDSTAAVLLEAVQGEGGVHPAADGYLKAVKELCEAHGALLIIDEVQTGFGRTGTLFAHFQDDAQPDMMTNAKSIAGGIPMGAVLLREGLGPIAPGAHGSTFGGNPLACAAGLATLDVLENSGMVENAYEHGAELRQYFEENLSPDIVREVRGRGYMFGIELRTKITGLLPALQEQGIVALPAGITVLRLLPPLVIERSELERVAEIIVDVVNSQEI